MSQDNSPEVLGTVIGERYQILERIGRGGMGAVYKARHVSLGSLFAVKVLLKGQVDKDQARFVREAQLASSLRHPNIVYIADFGVLPDGRPYLAMEYLEGPTLKMILKQGPLDILRACRIARQIAQGMQSAHQRGIIHRDLKPDNIILTAAPVGEKATDGAADWVKIIDFGIAKLAPAAPIPDGNQQAAAQLTQHGAMIGTPAYMSPEQGRSAVLDARTDQYSLGCILYHMLAGVPPFPKGDFIELLMRHISEPPQPLRQRQPERGISDSLDALVMRLLSKAPADRFPSMTEVAAELDREIGRLEAARGGRPSPSQPSGAVPGSAADAPADTVTQQAQTTKQSAPATRWWRLAVLVAAGLALVVGVGFFAYQRRPVPPRSGPLTSDELRLLQQRAVAALGEALKDAGLRAPTLLSIGRSRNGAAFPLLADALKQSEPTGDAAVVDALGQLGDRRALPLLGRTAADSPTPAVRLAAAQALFRLGEKEGEQALTAALSDANEGLRLQAALALCDGDHAQATQLLGDLRERDRLPAALGLVVDGCLVSAGSESARGRLHDRLTRAGSQSERLAAAARLAPLGDGPAQELLRGLAARPSPDQMLAARLLASPSEPGLAPLFRGVLEDAARGGASDAAPQVVAAEGLALCGEPADARLLDRLLDNGTPAVRQAAAGAMLRLLASDPRRLSEQSLAWARDALADPSWLVRQSAAAVLGDLQRDDALPLLSRLVDDDDDRVRLGALRALRQQRAAIAAPVVLRGLGDSSQAVRREALRALLRLFEQGDPAHTVDKQVTARVAELVRTGSPAEQVLGRGILLKLGDRSQLPTLRGLSASNDPELRRLLLEATDREPEALAALLADADPEVRWLAARRLAELGDHRATPVLLAVLRGGGEHALSAYGLLMKLGERVEQPRDVFALLSAPQVELRMSAVEAAPQLPVSLALPLLRRAARDPESLVRRLTAEVSVELPLGPSGPMGLEVLRLLADDSDALVRSRAAVLMARLLGAPAIVEKDRNQESPADAAAPAAPAPPQPPAAHGDDKPATPRPASGGSGMLLVKGGRLAQFQLDKRPWQQVSGAPISLPAGGHRVTFLGGSQQIYIESGKTLTLDAPESQSETLSRTGIDAFERKDFKKAQRLLDKVRSLCGRERAMQQPCSALTYELSYYQAQMYESQERWADAMNEYKDLAGQSGLSRNRAERAAAVQRAMTRLAPRLGQVVISKRQGARCQPVPVWMPPGTHVVNVNGQSQTVKVRAGETIRVGACQ